MENPAHICVEINLLVFIQNLLMHLAEKILLMQPLTFGGDYRPGQFDAVLGAMRRAPDPVAQG